MPRCLLAGDNEPVMNVSVAEWLREGSAALMRTTGPLPRPTRRSWVFDAVFALAFCTGGVHYALSSGVGRSYLLVDGVTRLRPAGADTWVGAVVPVLVATLPLALRRRYPLAVLWLVMGGGLAAPDSEARIVFYVLVVAVYSAVAYSPYRIPTLASVPVALLVLGTSADSAVPTVPDETVPLLVLVPLAVAANGLRMWQLRADERQTRMAALERERAEELLRAAERERARIARELHDVVTHHVSMMTIQAGAARAVLDTAPEQTREALLAVEKGGRSAMTELRHAMGLLTMNTDDIAEPATATSVGLAPQPGLDQVEALVARVRDTGVAIGLTVTGTPRPVSSGISLAAYRVVQEALTNMVKHAAGASAAVVVEYDEDHLRVAITDSGGRPSLSAATGNGHGLIGLRERLTIYGGTLQAGQHPGSGGYRILASIPLEEV